MDNTVSVVGFFCRSIYCVYDSRWEMVQRDRISYSHGCIWSVLGYRGICRSNGWGSQHGPVGSIRTASYTGDCCRLIFCDQSFPTILPPAKKREPFVNRFNGFNQNSTIVYFSELRKDDQYGSKTSIPHLPASNKGHFGCQNRHEHHIRVQWQACHVNNCIRNVAGIHSGLH